MLPGFLKGLEYKLEETRDNIFELQKCFSNIMRDKISTYSASKNRKMGFSPSSLINCHWDLEIIEKVHWK